MNKNILLGGWLITGGGGLIAELLGASQGHLNPYLASSLILLTLWLAYE